MENNNVKLPETEYERLSIRIVFVYPGASNAKDAVNDRREASARLREVAENFPAEVLPAADAAVYIVSSDYIYGVRLEVVFFEREYVAERVGTLFAEANAFTKEVVSKTGAVYAERTVRFDKIFEEQTERRLEQIRARERFLQSPKQNKQNKELNQQ